MIFQKSKQKFSKLNPIIPKMGLKEPKPSFFLPVWDTLVKFQEKLFVSWRLEK